MDGKSVIYSARENLVAVDGMLQLDCISETTRKELTEYRDELRQQLRILLAAEMPDSDVAAA